MPHGRDVSWRAAAISLAIILISIPAIFYGEVVWGIRYAGDVTKRGIWSTDAPAVWPLTVLFLAAAVMSLPVLRRIGLTRRELLTIHAAVLVSTPLLGSGILFFMLSMPLSYPYFGHALDSWQLFLPMIPSWFGPTTRAGVDGYFTGQSAVPWRQWILPLAAWGSFAVCLFAARTCLLALVQRQWIRNERLTMPLAEIPLQMIERDAGHQPARLTRDKLFWLGLAIAAALSFLSTLSTRLPAMPLVPLTAVLMTRQEVGPFAALGQVEILMIPWLIALAYIVPKELSFTVWVLWLLKVGATMLAISFGASPGAADDWWTHDFPAPFDQVTGAVIVLSAWVLFRARRHLVRALRIAFAGGHTEGDADEPISYRWAIIIFVVCCCWMVGLLVLAGCRLSFGLLYVGLIVGAGFAYARVCAETAFDPTTAYVQNVVPTITGTLWLRPRELISLFTLGWTYTPFPSQVMAVNSMDAVTSFKIGDAAGIPLRRLTRLLFVGFLVALGIGSVYMLRELYTMGLNTTRAGSVNSFPGWYLRASGDGIFGAMTDQKGPEWAGIAWYGVGALTFIFVAAMRLRFLWWPFHPMGYILGLSILADEGRGESPFFIAWLAKTLVLKYGGLRLYQRTLTIAIGLIVGDVLNRSLWNVISLATHGHF